MALDISKIKTVMATKNIGNKDLSVKAGVPLRTVNNILGGITANPTIDNMISIAHALGCKVDDFVIDERQPLSDIDTLAAHHDEEDWTDAELAEIEDFMNYVRSKRK